MAHLAVQLHPTIAGESCCARRPTTVLPRPPQASSFWSAFPNIAGMQHCPLGAISRLWKHRKVPLFKLGTTLLVESVVKNAKCTECEGGNVRSARAQA